MRQKIDRQQRVTGYTIQLGAFSQPSNARQAARTWRGRASQRGLGEPRLLRSQNEGQTLTLVQLGRFNTVRAANQARDRLGASEAIVVPLAGGNS
jgi:cell division protein FtsN